MAKSLREIKTRIRSIENTRKVTSALEMISVAKLNRIERSLVSFRPYFSRLETMLGNIMGNLHEGIAHPLLEERISTNKYCLCIVTSDGGLCGTYNNQVLRASAEFIRSHGGISNVSIVSIGRKGYKFALRAKADILRSYVGLNGRYSESVADEISTVLIDLYNSGTVDAVYLAHMHYQTALLQRPVLEKFLNLKPADTTLRKADYIFETPQAELLQEMIPRHIAMKMRLVLLDAFCSEHACRTVAMRQATDNAKELLEALVLTRNKIRQANITQEIMEVVSSTEALKG